jgi:CMP-N-acetylneuraminic acid synthetase
LNFGWKAQIGVICARANWSKEIKKLHINMKELIVVLYGIKSLKEKLKGKKICIRIDNKVVISYLNKITRKMKHLAEIVIHSEVMEMGL